MSVSRTSTIRAIVIVNAAVAVVATAVVLWLEGRVNLARLPANLLYMWVYSNTIGSLCAMVIPAVARRLWDYSPALQWSTMIAAMMGLNFVGAFLGTAIIAYFEPAVRQHFWAQAWGASRFGLIITLILGISQTLFEHYRVRYENARELAVNAQLASLESRIQPHFLFNALNSISSLIREDPARAEHLLGRFAALLRASLDAPRSSLVPVEEEMRLVSGYLEIQQARFDGRLRYSIDVDPAASAVEVPVFAAQTLVENSVKFAVAPRREGGEVAVVVRRAGDAVNLTVSDNGPGFDGRHLPAGHGLDNLRERLTVLFGDRASLEIGGSGPGAEVTIRVPVRRSNAA